MQHQEVTRTKSESIADANYDEAAVVNEQSMPLVGASKSRTTREQMHAQTRVSLNSKVTQSEENLTAQLIQLPRNIAE